MNTITIRLASALAAGLVSASLCAQDPDAGPAPAPATAGPAAMARAAVPEPPAGPVRTGQPLPSARVPIHTAASELGVGYGIWAAGADYKASFHAGMCFVPYLGADYPQNQPFAWRTVSARVGPTELIEGHVAPVTAQQDYRYEYRFGGVTEAYDVLAEGLEQTFVIDRLPAAGDLVIEGAVTTDLVADAVPAARQALEFRDAAGAPILRYGAALAFDAAGNTAPVTTSFAAGRITLTVPGAWLAAAELPVVVDPLLQRVVLSTSPSINGMTGAVDIARDDEATVSNVLVAHTRWSSQQDSDLFARLVDDDFSPGVNGNNIVVFSDITTSWHSLEPACAFVGGADRWAMVFERQIGYRHFVRCHVHGSGDTSLQTNVGVLAAPVHHNDWNADIGGVESFAAGDRALVVFQREDNTATSGTFQEEADSGVYGSLLDVTTANGTFGAAFPIHAAANQDAERPSVNKVAEGGAFSWICAFQVYDNSIPGDDWDVVARRISSTGVLASGQYVTSIAQANTDHQLGPVVEGMGGRYAVAMSTVDLATEPTKTAERAGKRLCVQRFDWPNLAQSPTVVSPLVTLRGSASRIWEATDVAYDTRDDSHFAVASRTVAPGSPSAWFTRIGYDGGVTEGYPSSSSLLYYAQYELPTEVACVFDNDNDRFMFVYGFTSPTNGNPVYGHLLDYEAPTPASTAGFGCSGAAIGWFGNQQIGAEFNGVGVTGAGAGDAHFLMVALSFADQAVPYPEVGAGCRLLVPAWGPAHLGTLPLRIGANPTWAMALPSWLDPVTLHFQDWIFDGSQLRSTQRLTVPVVK